MLVWKSILMFFGVAIASLGGLFSHPYRAYAISSLDRIFAAYAPTSVVGTIRHIRINPDDDSYYVLGSSTTTIGKFSSDGSTFSTITYDNPLPTNTSSDFAVSNQKIFVVTGGSGSSNAIHRYDVSGSTANLIASSPLGLGSSAVTIDRETNTIYASKNLSAYSLTTDLERSPTSTLGFSATRLAHNGTRLYYVSTLGRFISLLFGLSETLIASGGPSSVTLKGFAVSQDGGALYYANSTSLVKLSPITGSTLWSQPISNIAGLDLDQSTGKIAVIDSSGAVSVYDPISPVSGVSISASGTSALLTWTSYATDEDYAGTTIRRSGSGFPTSPTDGTAVTSSSLSTTYTDTDLSDGTYYYSFFHKTFDRYYSTAATSSVVIDTPPSAPILAAATDGSDVSLTWSVPSDTSSFMLRRSTDHPPINYTDGTLVTSTNATVTSLIDRNLIDGTHYYSIFAVDAGGNYSEAGTASVTIDTVGPIAPTLSVIASGSTVSLSWDTPLTTISFLLRHSTSEFPATVSAGMAVTSTTYTSFVASDVTDGEHYYSVFARDSYGNYSTPGMASTTIDTVSPSAPTGFSAVTNGSTINLHWANPIDADFSSSTIRRSTSSPPSSPTSGTAVISTSATTYSDTSLADGTYYYSIFAIDRTGNVSTLATSTATINTYVAPSTTTPSGGGGGGLGSSSAGSSLVTAALFDFSPPARTITNVTPTPSSPSAIAPSAPNRMITNPLTIFARILRQGDQGAHTKAFQPFVRAGNFLLRVGVFTRAR